VGNSKWRIDGLSVIVQIDKNVLNETNIVKCKSLLSLHQSIRGPILETVIIPTVLRTIMYTVVS
jgi:hypothetical protein